MSHHLSSETILDINKLSVNLCDTLCTSVAGQLLHNLSRYRESLTEKTQLVPPPGEVHKVTVMIIITNFVRLLTYVTRIFTLEIKDTHHITHCTRNHFPRNRFLR